MKKNASQTVAITGTAAISPVGLNVKQTCASIRAGITRFAEHAYYECVGVDPEWDETEPLIASPVPSMDPFLDGPERLIQLVIPSLSHIIADAKLKRRELQSGGLLLALPQQDNVVKKWSLESLFIPELLKRTGLNPFKIQKVDQTGHTGIFCLIREAKEILTSGDVEFCIVGGVDSYLEEERLEFLDKSWRIKSGKKIDGYIPGEASSLLFLETIDNARSGGRLCLAKIISCEIGEEKQLIDSDRNSSGVGLSEAIEKALNNSSESTNIQWVICDLNGENYRSFEWGVVMTRISKFFSENLVVHHPSDCVGDVGAATGGMLIASAIQAYQRGYNISDKTLLWASADEGCRAALYLSQYADKA